MKRYRSTIVTVVLSLVVLGISFDTKAQTNPRHYRIGFSLQKANREPIDLEELKSCDLSFENETPGNLRMMVKNGIGGPRWEFETAGRPGDKIVLKFEWACEFQNGEFTVTLGQETEVNAGNFILKRDLSAEVFGEVTDDDSGDPVPGAKVSAVDPITEEKHFVTTDVNGQFRFTFKAGKGQMIRIMATKGNKKHDQYAQAGYRIQLRVSKPVTQ